MLMKLNSSCPSMTKKRPSPPLNHQHHILVFAVGANLRQMGKTKLKQKNKNALCYRFSPCTVVHTGVSLLERGTTLNLLALFQYFRQEWMTNYRMSLWNARDVNIRTNNYLEGWHNRLNNKAVGNKLGFNKLLLLLLQEQDVMETLMPSS
ncbi:hypothetical protein T01_7682, partial [Trichinella spiralis]